MKKALPQKGGHTFIVIQSLHFALSLGYLALISITTEGWAKKILPSTIWTLLYTHFSLAPLVFSLADLQPAVKVKLCNISTKRAN